MNRALGELELDFLLQQEGGRDELSAKIHCIVWVDLSPSSALPRCAVCLRERFVQPLQPCVHTIDQPLTC